MFLAIAFLNAGLGVLASFRPAMGAGLFTATLFVVPSSLAFDEWTYRYGLHGHDFFFLVLLALQALRSLASGSVGKARDFVLLGIVFIASSIGFIAESRDLDKYALRDLRPILIVVEATLFFALLSRARVFALGARGALWLGIAAGGSAFFGFGLIMFGWYDVGDVYYQVNSFRYLAVGSYAAAVFLVWLAGVGNVPFSSMRALWVAALAVASAAVVLSGSRMLVGATLVGCISASRMRPARVIATFFGAATLVGVFIYVSEQLSVTRVTDAMTLEGLRAQLSVRYAPALERIEEMSWWQWVVGAGSGATFDIPWFGYRGLDQRHNSIDSTYVTMFVKYGVLSLLYLWVLGRAFGVTRLPGAAGRGLGAFLLFLGVTMAVPYQKFAIGIPVAWAYFSQVALARKARPERAMIEGNRRWLITRGRRPQLGSADVL